MLRSSIASRIGGAGARLPRPFAATLGLQISKKVPLKKKEVDDVLGGEEAWANVQKTDGAYSKVYIVGVWRGSKPGSAGRRSRRLRAMPFAWETRCRRSSQPCQMQEGGFPAALCPLGAHDSALALFSLLPPPLASPCLPAATCPKCTYHQAYFMEIQTRSADEPATLFFKCVKCGAQWREG